MSPEKFNRASAPFQQKIISPGCHSNSFIKRHDWQEHATYFLTSTIVTAYLSENKHKIVTYSQYPAGQKT
jgi:hypothetical protein